VVLEVLHVGVAETFAAAVTATAVAVTVAMNVAVAISVATIAAIAVERIAIWLTLLAVDECLLSPNFCGSRKPRAQSRDFITRCFDPSGAVLRFHRRIQMQDMARCLHWFFSFGLKTSC
jgi:hypothetical protein